MRVARIHSKDGGVQTAIIGDPGRIWTPYVMIDFPVRLRKIRNTDTRYVKDMDYPLKKAVRHYLRIGRDKGITNGAKKFLRSALA